MAIETHEILGLMSGSSLDGLDLAWCRFERSARQMPFSYQLLETNCISFPENLRQKLAGCREMPVLELAATEQKFVVFCAEAIRKLCEKTGRQPLAVASHGHTVFHNPAEGYTLQIGNGGLLYGLCGIPIVSDFRTVDVGLGGQGAPLVPGAEAELFADFTACLNLGGICNVSFPGVKTTGSDLAPCNQVLNYISLLAGKPYDDAGRLAASGKEIPELRRQLDAIPFYENAFPKSLSNEMVAANWIPVLNSCGGTPPDILFTLCQHIAGCVAAALPAEGGRMLVSGGGAFNLFLLDQLELACGENWQLIRADEKLAGFKEALCFAWLGLKRLLNEMNVPASVTGASRNSVSGALYGPHPLFPGYCVNK